MDSRTGSGMTTWNFGETFTRSTLRAIDRGNVVRL